MRISPRLKEEKLNRSSNLRYYFVARLHDDFQNFCISNRIFSNPFSNSISYVRFRQVTKKILMFKNKSAEGPQTSSIAIKFAIIEIFKVISLFVNPKIIICLYLGILGFFQFFLLVIIFNYYDWNLT